MVSVVDFEQELRSRISGRRAITYIEELVAVGDRFVGSEGDRAAAEIIRAKGQAEADAMHLKAEAFSEYSQAAVLDKLLTGLPEVVKALSEPLAKVDKITVVSTGGDHNGLGMSQITADLTRMVAQAPALFETLTGLKVSELMSRLPGLSEAHVPHDGRPTVTVEPASSTESAEKTEP